MPRQFPTSIVDQTTKIPASVEDDGSLNVKVTAMPAITVDPPVGGSTEAKQDTGNASLATLAGTVVLGRVQVDAEIAPVAGAATEAKQDTIIGHVDGIETVLGTIDADTSVLAGAVTAGKVQVEVTNSPAISGTVTANLSATDNAVLDAIEADTTVLAGAVSGTEMQVDVVTMPTTTVQATDLDIRNLVAATDGVTASVPTGGGATILHAAVDIAAATTTQIVAAAGGSLKCKVLSWFLFSAGTNTVTLKRGTTKLAGDFAMTVGMPLGMSGSILAPVFATAANEALNITTSGTSQLSGHITYILEA